MNRGPFCPPSPVPVRHVLSGAARLSLTRATDYLCVDLDPKESNGRPRIDVNRHRTQAPVVHHALACSELASVSEPAISRSRSLPRAKSILRGPLGQDITGFAHRPRP